MKRKKDIYIHIKRRNNIDRVKPFYFQVFLGLLKCIAEQSICASRFTKVTVNQWKF